jgi:hypothetical protein
MALTANANFLRYALVALGLFFVSTQANAANCGTAGANNCFWIGGTGTLDDATDSAHWSNTTGGTTCSCEPLSGNNNLVFDASSGGGTVTPNVNWTTASTSTVTTTGFTGTIDFSTNNNSWTVGSWLATSGTQTLNLGTGTLTTTGSSGLNIQVAAMTLIASSSTYTNTNTIGNTTLALQSTMSLGNIVFAANTQTLLTNSWTIAGTVTGTAPFSVTGQSGSTTTLSGTAFNLTSTAASPISILSAGSAATWTLSTTSGGTITWGVVLNIIKAGAGTITVSNCLKAGNSGSGVTCNAPSGGGGRIIGG